MSLAFGPFRGPNIAEMLLLSLPINFVWTTESVPTRYIFGISICFVYMKELCPFLFCLQWFFETNTHVFSHCSVGGPVLPHSISITVVIP